MNVELQAVNPDSDLWELRTKVEMQAAKKGSESNGEPVSVSGSLDLCISRCGDLRACRREWITQLSRSLALNLHVGGVLCILFLTLWSVVGKRLPRRRNWWPRTVLPHSPVVGDTGSGSTFSPKFCDRAQTWTRFPSARTRPGTSLGYLIRQCVVPV